MFDFIAYPIGVILKVVYDQLAFHNYGLAIIVLTVTIRALVLPLYIKQMHTTEKMSEFQPEIQRIQKKYANDQAKLSQATMEFYQEKGFNPIGGCLPLAIQIPILFSLYYVISEPLKFMLGKSPETINKLYNLIPAGADRIANLKDISIISYFSAHSDRLKDISSMLKPTDLLNMNFFGVNLGTVPTLNINQYIGGSIHTNQIALLIVPLLAALTTYMSTKVSMMQTNQTQPNEASALSIKSMLIISPLMTGYFAFTVPAGLGLYWIAGNFFLIFQQLIINKYVLTRKVKQTSEKKSVPIMDGDSSRNIYKENESNIDKDNVKAQSKDDSNLI